MGHTMGQNREGRKHMVAREQEGKLGSDNG